MALLLESHHYQKIDEAKIRLQGKKKEGITRLRKPKKRRF